jgi:hypothetical protein
MKWYPIFFVILIATDSLFLRCAGPEKRRLPSPAQLVKQGEHNGKYELSELEEGRTLFIKECASCHRHYWPAEYTPQRWREILHRHRKRGSLTQQQFAPLEKYLTLASHYALGSQSNKLD